MTTPVSGITAPNMTPSNFFQKKACDNKSGLNKLHYVWILPINALTSLATAISTPLVSLIQLISATINKIIAQCSSNTTAQTTANTSAQTNFIQAISQVTDNIITLFIRIFYPSFTGVTCVGTALSNCLAPTAS